MLLLGAKLLPLCPVISSTASLLWAYDEYAFFSAWMNPAYRAQADALLPAWFKAWAPKGTRVLFTSFFNQPRNFAHRESLKASGALKWYWLGVFFAFAHFFYGPTALGLLKAIRDGEPNGQTTISMGKWLRMHRLRTITTDLPAFICFTIAAATAM
ncbi:hypothetical protein B0H16DRAFT_1902232, partial [Mycena metata]